MNERENGATLQRMASGLLTASPCPGRDGLLAGVLAEPAWPGGQHCEAAGVRSQPAALHGFPGAGPAEPCQAALSTGPRHSSMLQAQGGALRLEGAQRKGGRRRKGGKERK